MSTVPFQTPNSGATDYSALQFIVERFIGRMATVQLVIVRAVRNDGGIVPTGTVDVQLMVHQVNGAGEITPHGITYDMPYLRVQGGVNAIIIDPEVGDIGVAVFCMRDIAAVKASKAPAAPGSGITYDYSSGLYLGGFLNGVPQQYIRYFSGGIEVISPTKIKLAAPNVEIVASTQLTVTTPASEFSGNIHTPQTITGDTDVIAHGTSGHSHTHGGVQSGGSNTNPPN